MSIAKIHSLISFMIFEIIVTHIPSYFILKYYCKKNYEMDVCIWVDTGEIGKILHRIEATIRLEVKKYSYLS